MTISAITILQSLLDAQPKRFTMLAQAWLSGGASGVEICDLQRPLARWGDGDAGDDYLSAMICYRREAVGELRVCGAFSAAQQARLDADADLIGQMLRLNTEVDAVTDELVDTQDQLLALYQINRSAGGRLQLSEALGLLADEARRLLKAETAFVCLQGHGDQQPTVYQAGQHMEQIPAALYQRLLEAGREQLFGAPDSNGVWPGIRSLIYVPIIVRDIVVAGGLCLTNRPGAFSSPELKLARAIAEHAGTVIERGLLYEDQIDRTRMQAEMDLARTVQRGLLPHHPPDVPGLDLFARSLPALQVGGDFFDFVISPDRPLILTLGDVTGKGIPAALLMAMVRTALRGKANFMPLLDPVKIMTRANEDLYADFTEVGMFATVFVGMYEPTERTLYYANAGHAPVIYRPAGCLSRLLEADGVPMGVLDDPLCTIQAVPLGPGDLLVLATDGFNEAISPDGAMFTIERLLTLMDVIGDQPASVIAAALFAAVAAFSAGREQSDDQTLVVIKGVPTP